MILKVNKKGTQILASIWTNFQSGIKRSREVTIFPITLGNFRGSIKSIKRSRKVANFELEVMPFFH